MTDPCQLHGAQKEFGEQDHQAPITKKVKEFVEIGTHSLLDYLGTSCFQSHMRYDDSVESIEDSEEWRKSAKDILHKRRIISCSVEVHRRYQNNIYITRRNVGKTFSRLQERGWRKRIVSCTDSFQNIHFIERKATGRIHMVRCEDLQGNKQPLVQKTFGQICGHLCPMQRKKSKQRWAIEKLKLDNARQLRGILEVPMPAAMPCKIPIIKSSGETHRNVGKRKTKYAGVVDADECTRPRLESVGHNLDQDHITAKGMNSMTHYSVVHKFIPMPQALKSSVAKGAVEKEWEKPEKIPAWQLTKVRNKSEATNEARIQIKRKKESYPSRDEQR